MPGYHCPRYQIYRKEQPRTMLTAFVIRSINKTLQERFQLDHSGLALTLAGVRTPSLAAPFDGGLVF